MQTYGAEENRKLGIPGEDLNNIISGRNFVGWYNGSPMDKDLNIDLDKEEAVIIGQGNVAVDVARILLTPIDKLKVIIVEYFQFNRLYKNDLLYTDHRHNIVCFGSVVSK